MRLSSRNLFSFFLVLFSTSALLAGPKGTISVPRISSPITIDGDFSDWPLTNYTTVAQQPLFPEGQGVGVPTNANGDHLVWDIDRVGPFNGTDLEIYEPDSASEFGASMYFAYDDSFLYVLGVFIDDELNGVRAEDGLSNFLNDGFEFFIDSLGDSAEDGFIAEFGFPTIDEEEPNLDDFQFTFGLNDSFEADNPGPNEIGAEVHVERAGDPELPKLGYLDIRDATDFSAVGGRDVAAKSYDDLRAAGAQNPEILANADETFTGYAAELVVPFGIAEGFNPDHNMGFALFWRDVDDHEDPQAGFGGGNIFWTDWSQNTSTSGAGEEGNLFHAGNWGQLEFVGSLDPTIRLDDGSLTDATERVNYVHDVLGTWMGDANLDGEFNSSDFVAVFTAGEYEDLIGGNSTWATGDWNGDGEFNSSDFVVAFADGGFELGPRPAAAQVPEPTSATLLVLCLGGFVVRLRRAK